MIGACELFGQGGKIAERGFPIVISEKLTDHSWITQLTGEAGQIVGRQSKFVCREDLSGFGMDENMESLMLNGNKSDLRRCLGTITHVYLGEGIA